MSPRFAIRHANAITGTFVLAVMLLLLASLVWTGRSQRWFKGNVLLRIVLPETGAAGVRQGSEVYFLGTLVGTVSDLLVDEQGRMEAHAHIRRDFFRFVRSDSSAVVKRKFGVAGDSFFEIIRGEGGPLPEHAASIVCNEQFQSALEAAVEQVRHEALVVLNNLNNGLDTWTRLGTELGDTRRRLDQLADRLDQMVARVESGHGTLGQFMNNTALADDARKLLADTAEAVSGWQGVGTNLQAVARNLKEGTARFPEIAGAVADETKNLPGLVLQLQVSMRELQRMVEAIQRHWMLRKYVNHTEPPRPLPPSGDDAEAHEPQPAKKLKSPKSGSR